MTTRDTQGSARADDQAAARVRRSRTVMREVADRAGVGVSSVSRVLSGHPDVSAVMRNRVLDAVAALEYQPDLLAQSLRTGATMTTGFLVGDISNPLMSEIALGAEIELRNAGYSMVLMNSVNDPELDVSHLRILTQRRVDGVLLSLTDEADPVMRSAIADVDIPCVLVDRQLDGIELGAVLSDHAGGITSAVEHLIELGHRHVALVNGSQRVRPSRERAKAMKRIERRHPGVTCVVRSQDFSAEHGYQATRALVEGKNRPTALVAGSNQILVGVLRALRDLELSIPDDMSLVTCDDVPLSEFLVPMIATISRDPREMGRAGAELLVEQLKGGPLRELVLPTGFRPTGSCAPPPRPEGHV